MAGCSVQNLKGPKVINSIVGALRYMHVDFHTLLTDTLLESCFLRGNGGGMKSLVLFEGFICLSRFLLLGPSIV